MTKTLVIIQARMSSKRLPGKALKLINKKPIILICVNRLKNRGHNLIVATSKNKSDDKLVKVLKKNNIKYFRGSKNNVLSRFTTITKKFKPDDLIVRATADNILPDGNLIHLLIKELKKRNLNYLSINKKIHLLPKGFSLEIFKVKELTKINKLKLNKEHLEHVTLKMYEKKEKKIFIKKLFQKKNLSSKRATIDTKKDYQSMKNYLGKVKNLYQVSSFELVKKLPL